VKDRDWRCAVCGCDLWPTARERLLREYGVLGPTERFSDLRPIEERLQPCEK